MSDFFERPAAYNLSGLVIVPQKRQFTAVICRICGSNASLNGVFLVYHLKLILQYHACGTWDVCVLWSHSRISEPIRFRHSAGPNRSRDLLAHQTILKTFA